MSTIAAGSSAFYASRQNKAMRVQYLGLVAKEIVEDLKCNANKTRIFLWAWILFEFDVSAHGNIVQRLKF